MILHSSIKHWFLLIFLAMRLTACDGGTGDDVEIAVNLPCKLSPGGTLTLALRGKIPADAQVEWEADRGTLTESTGLLTRYTAPSSATTDIIIAKVTSEGTTISRQLSCEVEAITPDTPTPEPPANTPVPKPTDTPTTEPTSTPVPKPTDTPTPQPTDTPIPLTDTPTSTNTPVPTPVIPSVIIGDNIKDENGNPIDKNSAPFKVRVGGTVSNAQGLYLYLVVDDGNAEWIQPGLGQNMEGDFEGNSYLGIENDPNSLNKQYRIFAVVTDKEHKEYEHLDRGSIKASSVKIDLFRK